MVIGSWRSRRYSKAPATGAMWVNADLFGEEPPHFQVQVDPLFGLAQEFQDEQVTVINGRIALFGLDDGRRHGGWAQFL